MRGSCRQDTGALAMRLGVTGMNDILEAHGLPVKERCQKA